MDENENFEKPSLEASSTIRSDANKKNSERDIFPER